MEIQELKNRIKELEKENEKYIRIFNETEKIMNKQERTIDKLEKENEELKENSISKDIIRDKIKELEDKDKMFTIELPEDVTIYQYAIDILEELLGE